MSKVTKIPKSYEEMIAEMEIQRLYEKSMNSIEGLSLEDTKKFDILVKTLKEAQKDSNKELEAKYYEMKKKLIEELPTEALIEFIENNYDTKEEQTGVQSISSDEEVDQDEATESGTSDPDRSE